MILAADPIKVDGLCSTRRIAGKGQLVLPDEGIDQAGFPNVAPP
jgi:hypothetical protein